MIFNSGTPSPIFGCKEEGGGDNKFHPDPVVCFADLSQPIPAGIEAGDRYIAQNVSSPDPSWINLPSGLQENDIIEKDFQNLNWLLASDVSECGPGIFVYVECRGFYYWWDGFNWEEISPCNFGGLNRDENLTVTTNGQTNFTLSDIVQNPEKSIFKVNGLATNYGGDYVISGTTLTWVNTGYQLETDDCLQILYCA